MVLIGTEGMLHVGGITNCRDAGCIARVTGGIAKYANTAAKTHWVISKRAIFFTSEFQLPLQEAPGPLDCKSVLKRIEY